MIRLSLLCQSDLLRLSLHIGKLLKSRFPEWGTHCHDVCDISRGLRAGSLGSDLPVPIAVIRRAICRFAGRLTWRDCSERITRPNSLSPDWKFRMTALAVFGAAFRIISRRRASPMISRTRIISRWRWA